MTPALREWAVTVRALAEGEQFVTLLQPQAGHAAPEMASGSRFFLLPDFEGRQAKLVRESHLPEVRRALEDGVWERPSKIARQFKAGFDVPDPEAVRLRAWAEVVERHDGCEHGALKALEPFHVWRRDHAAERFNADSEGPLDVVLLRVHRIPRPVTIHGAPAVNGTGRWTEFDRELDFEGTPVVSDEEFGAIRSAVNDALSA